MREAKNMPVMVRIKQASEMSGITEYRLRQLCKEGKIVCMHCGNRFLINIDRLIDYLNTGDGNE